MTSNNSTQNIPTPKADLLEHVQNFSEAGTFFSVSLGLALASVFFKQLEIIMAIAYVVAIIYTILSFENEPRLTFFRFTSITLGVSVGIRELLIFFWIPVFTAIVVVIAVGILGFIAYRYIQSGLNPTVGGR